jgi:hypothetical protein
MGPKRQGHYITATFKKKQLKQDFAEFGGGKDLPA